jgi:hypothetical protein
MKFCPFLTITKHIEFLFIIVLVAPNIRVLLINNQKVKPMGSGGVAPPLRIIHVLRQFKPLDEE